MEKSQVPPPSYEATENSKAQWKQSDHAVLNDTIVDAPSCHHCPVCIYYPVGSCDGDAGLVVGVACLTMTLLFSICWGVSACVDHCRSRKQRRAKKEAEMVMVNEEPIKTAEISKEDCE